MYITYITIVIRNIFINKLTTDTTTQTSALDSIQRGSGIIAENVQQTNTLDDTQVKPGIDGSSYSEVSQTPIELSKYLERPILLRSQNYFDSGTSVIVGAPYSVVYGTLSSRAKMSGYTLLRTGYKFTIVTNGNPFWVGRMRVSWVPHVAGMSAIETTMGRLSNLDGVDIDISANSTHEMVIPYSSMYPNFSLQTSGTVNQQGSLVMRSYMNASTVGTASLSNSDIRFDIYVSLVDPVLSVLNPTLLALESTFENFPRGILSGTATMIAKTSDKLGKIPGLGYMATVSKVADTLGKVANVFGFSKPANLLNPIDTQLTLFKNSQYTEGTDSGGKLCLDPKCEAIIDPAYLGTTAEDEMSIMYLIRKWSFLTTVLWSTSDAVNTVLEKVIAVPCHYNKYTSGTFTDIAHQYTSLGYVSLPFQYWRGSIEVRIEIIKSMYHKGILRVFYQPMGISGSPTGDLTQNAFVVFIDLETYTEAVDIIIPWSLPQDFEYVTARYPGQAQGSNNNGRLEVSVHRKLSSPISTTSVGVKFSIRGGKDFELAYPSSYKIIDYCGLPPVDAEDVTDTPNFFQDFLVNQVPPTSSFSVGAYTSYPIGAGVAPGDVVNQSTYVMGPLADVPSMAGAHFGEKITSVRSLIKRVSYYTSILPYFDDGANYDTTLNAVDIFGVSDVPIAPGAYYDTVGRSCFNMNAWTFDSYFRRLYTYSTGGIRYKVIYRSHDGVVQPYVRVFRGHANTGSFFNKLWCVSEGYGTLEEYSWFAHLVLNAMSIHGEILYKPNSLGGIEFEIPQGTLGRAHIISNEDKYRQIIGGAYVALSPSFAPDNKPLIDVYQGAADDTTYYGYRGVPMLYRYSQKVTTRT